MVPEHLLNPFSVDPTLEFPHPVQPVPHWSEHYMFFGYDPTAQIGFFVHIRRHPFDPHMWRANFFVYLPGDELLAAKYHGRDGHARGPGAGPLRITCVEPMRLWSVECDGVAYAVSRTQNTKEVLRDGPVEPIKLHVLLEAGVPFWDLKHKMSKEQTWGSQHWEQICSIRGEITYRGKTIRLAGSGMRDHSPGARDYGPVVSDFWLNAYFPSGKGFQAQLTRSEGLKSEILLGYLYRGDGTPLEVVEVLEGPHANDLSTPAGSIAADPMSDPGLKSFRVVLQTQRGRETIDGEILHTAMTTYVSPSEELIGTDFSRPWAAQLLTGVAHYRWNGDSGWGVRERIARINTLR